MAKIEFLSITNIMGIQKFEFPLGTITSVTEDNGRGKSSTFKSLLGLLDGGTNDPKLVRNGSESGEIMALLDNGVRIVKTVTRQGKGKLKVTDAAGKTIPNAAGYVRGLTAKLMSPV